MGRRRKTAQFLSGVADKYLRRWTSHLSTYCRTSPSTADAVGDEGGDDAARKEDEEARAKLREEEEKARRIPSYWSTTPEPAGDCVTVVPDFGRVAEMQALVDSTWECKWTTDRRRAEEKRVPTGGHVLMVLRVENHRSFSRYCEHRAAVLARQPSCERFPVATGSPDHLLADANELYLFHGTSPASADAIARSEFRLDKAGSAAGMMLGPGLYLAESAAKSDEYAKEGDGIFLGQCALLVCRAVAGRVLVTVERGDMQHHVASGNYDSVCGDRRAAVGTFREIVFFDEAAVYCEFIVIYTRRFGEPGTAPAPPAAPKGRTLTAAMAALTAPAAKAVPSSPRPVSPGPAPTSAWPVPAGMWPASGNRMKLKLLSHPGKGLKPEFWYAVTHPAGTRIHCHVLRLCPAAKAVTVLVTNECATKGSNVAYHKHKHGRTFIWEEAGMGLQHDCGKGHDGTMIGFTKSGPSDAELHPRRIPFYLRPDGTAEFTYSCGPGMVMGLGRGIRPTEVQKGPKGDLVILVPRGDPRMLVFNL